MIDRNLRFHVKETGGDLFRFGPWIVEALSIARWKVKEYLVSMEEMEKWKVRGERSQGQPMGLVLERRKGKRSLNFILRRTFGEDDGD